MKTTRIEEDHCPYCGAALSGATHAGEASPTPNSVSICAYCAKVSIFGDDLMLRVLTEAEAAQIETAPEFRRLVEFHQRIVKEIQRKRAAK